MPDVYFWDVGSYDLGGPTCSQADASLFRNSAWRKLHLGWITPTVVTSDGFYSVPVTTETGGAFIFYDPDKGTEDYLVIENRAQTAGTYDQGASATGLVTWRLEDDAYPPDGVGDTELGPTGGFIRLVRPS